MCRIAAADHTNGRLRRVRRHARPAMPEHVLPISRCRVFYWWERSTVDAADRRLRETGTVDPMEGTVLGGRYRLEERLSAAGTGDEWRCVDLSTGGTVVAVLLRFSVADHPDAVGRLQLGWAREMACINRHDVVRVYGTGVDPETGAYVVMEYVEGDSLARILARDGKLLPSRTMDIVARIADAVQALHDRGIVHRELRPSAIVVRADATVVLLAFGLERLVHQPTRSGPFFGRPLYLSPEQLGQDRATYQSDVFSLGAIAYQCLGGRLPFDGENPLEVALRIVREQAPPLPADVPTEVKSIVERAMAKDPADRWPSAAAFADAARAAG
jgi:serine/threonine-protein kinase